MEFLGKSKIPSEGEENGIRLYNALSAGDLPLARLIAGDTAEKSNPASAFNQGLCLFLLEEWEKALNELKNAERLIGNPPEYEISERKLFIKAIDISEQRGSKTHLLPLDPDSVACRTRYGLIRIRWLTALCLINLGRNEEAAPVVRFLSQYNIRLRTGKDDK